jgi:hypothetical protein
MLEENVNSSKDVVLNKLLKKFRKPKSSIGALMPLNALALAACGNSEEDKGISLSVAENSESLVVGSVVATGEDLAATTYSLSGTDAESFTVSNGGELSLKASANFEVKSTYDVSVIASSTSVDAKGVEVVTQATREYNVAVENKNDVATGSVTIDGTPSQDQVLKADTSGITDEDGFDTVAYQWMRDGVDIDGGTKSELTLVHGDVGTAISVKVSYEDKSGATESFTSVATTSVENTNDSPVGVPTISGTLAEKKVLTADASGISDADGLGEFSYQWNRDGVAIDGATGTSYTLGELDVGKSISVSVLYTDGFGASEVVKSAASAAIAKENDAPTGSLVISGSAKEGETLILDTSTIADTDGLGTFNFTWLKDGEAISGVTSSSYSLTQGDVGSVISASLSYVDGSGLTETMTAAATSAVENVNDAPSGSLTITGSAEKGSVLTLDSSSIGDEDGLGAFTTVWKSDGSVISGASDSTFTLTADQVGKAISAVISYTDGQGTAETVTSASTSSVKDVIVESVGAFSVTNSGTSASPVLDFYLDASKDPGGDGVGSFDVVLDFTATEASYDSFSFASGLIGNANDTDASAGKITVGAIAFPNFTNLSTPLFTMNMTDLDTSADFAIYISGVSVDGTALDGTTSLIA